MDEMAPRRGGAGTFRLRPAVSLLARHAIIRLAFMAALNHAIAFGLRWPLPRAFELARNPEEQLLQSLGVSLAALRLDCIMLRAAPAGKRSRRRLRDRTPMRLLWRKRGILHGLGIASPRRTPCSTAFS